MRFAALILCAYTACSQTLYRVDEFAGSSYAGDGKAAVYAPLVQPQGLAFERDGSIIVADAGDHRIRRVLPNGLIQTVAGDGWAGFAGDGGPAGASRLQTPYGVAVAPNGDIYIADLGNGRVRKIAQDGQIRTFAGGGDQLPSTETPVKADEAKLQQPRNVAVDGNGIVYISDFGAHFIYRVTPDGMLLAICGTGEPGDTGDDKAANKTKLSGPAGLALDSTGALYIADSGNRRVRKIVNGWIDSVRDASRNRLDFGTVTSIAADRAGRLFAASGDRIPVVSSTGTVSAIDILADELVIDPSGRLLTVAQRQIRIHGTNTTTLIAGTGAGGYFGDGAPGDVWRFQRPNGLARDEAGNLYIADSSNGRVRRIAMDGTLSTIAAGFGQPSYFAFDHSNLLYFSDSKNGAVYFIDRSGKTKLFSRGSGAKPFRTPLGIAFDVRGDLCVADTGNGLIRKVAPDGYVTTIAGGGSSDKDGFALTLRLKNPVGIAIDTEGSVWFTESTRLRKLTPDGKITTINDIPLLDARGLRIDEKKRLLIADAGANRIIRVSPSGQWESLAGSGERGHAGDGGLALPALFDSPGDVFPELDGTVLVSDTGNNRVRRLTATTSETPEKPVAPITVLHAATLRQQPVAPGQVVFIDVSQSLQPDAIEVRFGSEIASIVAIEGNRITVVVPSAEQPGSVPVTITGSYTATGQVEIATMAPAIVGSVVNEDGSLNSAENPAYLGSLVTTYLTGEGNSSAPSISARLNGIPVDVISAEKPGDKPGRLKLTLQVPGGYFPAGTHALQIWIDGVKTLEDVMVVCR